MLAAGSMKTTNFVVSDTPGRVLLTLVALLLLLTTTAASGAGGRRAGRLSGHAARIVTPRDTQDASKLEPMKGKPQAPTLVGPGPACDPGSYLSKPSCQDPKIPCLLKPTCTPCPRGYYCPEGRTKVQCPDALTTVGRGAASQDLCTPQTQAAFSRLPSYNTSNVIINPDVLLLSNTSTFLLCNITTLILPADQATDLHVGNVIIGGINGFGAGVVSEDDLVCNLVTRVITSIEVVDGTVVLTTDPATLLDIVQEGDFDSTNNLPEPAPINVTELLTPATTLPAARAANTETSREAETTTVVFEAGGDEPFGTVKLAPTFGKNVDKFISGDLSIEPTLTNTLTAGLSYRVKRNLGFIPNVRALSIAVKHVEAINLKVTSKVSAGYTWSSDDLFKLM
jgi:hypothetical protein